MKGAVIAALIAVVAASVVYAAPVLAYMNGATDQARDRVRDQTCSCDCLQTQNQTCTQLGQRECARNQTCEGSMDCQQYQHQYQYRFRHQNISPQ